MATLGKWSGGVIGSLAVPETWTAPNGLFPTEDRNDSSAYSFTSSTSTLTLPSSGLADGYLLVAAFEYEDSSNGRFNPQGKIVQASGTGTFAGGPSGGYCRDTSEDRAYVRCWAFVDGPSASATFQFQWKADTDDAGASDGTVRSEFQVIPLYYSDVGVYTSTDASLYGGTTPTQVTGFTGTDGTNITISSNTVSMTGDNKRYLCLGSQFFEGRGGRTQRWHGFRVDGTKVDAAKAYSMYRSTANDESGDVFTWLIETATATVTLDQFCYRGDGVSNGQGGADVDGSTPAVGDHAIVVLELNDDAEVFRNTGNGGQNLATTGPVDLTICDATDIDFNDSASFVRATDTGMNAEVAMDGLFGANISAASEIVSSGSRWTAYAEFTIDGVEDADSFAGDYLRGNQSSQDCFGWSANLLGFQALSADEDIGVSVTELSGSEGGGGAVEVQDGWEGFWGINLDTLEASSSTYTLDAAAGSYTLTGTAATLLKDSVLDAAAGSYSLTGAQTALDWIAAKNTNVTLDVDTNYRVRFLVQETAGAAADNQTFQLQYNHDSGGWNDVNAASSVVRSTASPHVADAADTTQQLGSGTYLTSNDGFDEVNGEAGGADLDFAGSDEVELEFAFQIRSGDVADTDTIQLRVVEGDATVLGTYTNTPTITVNEGAGAFTIDAAAGSYTLSGTAASLEFGAAIDAAAGTYTLTGTDASLEFGAAVDAEAGSYALTGTAADLEFGAAIDAGAGSYALSGTDASLLRDAILSAVAGSYALTGQDAGLNFGTFIDAEAGSYTLTGANAALLRGALIDAAAGSYALSGTASDLLYGAVLDALAGSYALTGSDADLVHDGADPSILALAGSYALTGGAAALEFGALLDAAAGSYALTGQAASLEHGRFITAEAGAYSLTGTAAALEFGAVLAAAAGSYALTGQSADLVHGLFLDADAGTYALTGTDASLLRDSILSALAGSYALTGTDAVMAYGAALDALAGSYSLTGAAADLVLARLLAATAGAYALTGTEATLSTTTPILLSEAASELKLLDGLL